MKNEVRERYLILSDIHIPDNDKRLTKPILDFIKYYKPTHIDLLGDFFNFTNISSYAQDPFYKKTLIDEIADGKELLKSIVKTANKAYRGAEVSFFEGNHEARLSKFIAKNAPQLAELVNNNEYTLSIPAMLGLREMSIKYYPYYQIVKRHDVIFTHGHTVRQKSGYSAHSNIDRFGCSGFSGHTHKLAHITKTQSMDTKFWIETGCLCNLEPTPTYAVQPDWSQGFAIADLVGGKLYPQLIPIVGGKFCYDGILFK